MQKFKRALKAQAKKRPNAIALASTEISLSYHQLVKEVEWLANILQEKEIKTFAFLLPNSVNWILLDLAAVFANISTIPIPHFFSKHQIDHVIKNSGADCFIGETCNNIKLNVKKQHNEEIKLTLPISNISFTLQVRNKNKETINNWCEDKDILKVSYTSGSTSEPKGVKISAKAVDKLIESLRQVLKVNINDKHISILPYSLLLENIAGAYLILSSGGQCLIPSFEEVGLGGSSSLNKNVFVKLILDKKPSTMICVPAQLKALVDVYQELPEKIKTSFRYIAVGGAPVSNDLLQKAKKLNLPVFQGYGMTESSSVVAINIPGYEKEGSVGRVLPHVNIKMIDDEIVLSGATCLGYINDDEKNKKESIESPWFSGDTGRIDKQGYLYITGRKKTVYCTAFGRNIAPEWLESELLGSSIIKQAMVFGEALNTNIAFIYVSENSKKQYKDNEIDNEIAKINVRLPDYAQIGKWYKLERPFSVDNKELKPSGAMNRPVIIEAYKDIINALAIQD